MRDMAFRPALGLGAAATMYEIPLNLRFAGEAARRLGYDFEDMDPFSHVLARVSSNGRFAFVGAGRLAAFPINDAMAASIATDKTHSYELLARAGLRVPLSQIVFTSSKYAGLRPRGREIADAKRFAAKMGYPVFLKPNDGSRGNFAQSVSDEAELEAHLDQIAPLHPSAVVQEYLRGEERRLFHIDGEPLFAYSKTKPVLRGNGISTVEALLQSVDEANWRKGLSPANRRDPILLQSLDELGIGFGTVMPEGLEIAFSEKANVSGGGGTVDLREKFTGEERDMCRKTLDATGLRLCAIDLIVPEEGGEPVVLELNANPALSALETAGRTDLLLRIWTEVLVKALQR
jgi:glutathione synthase/RimK-type ligase-like ATP-grasp enzyme